MIVSEDGGDRGEGCDESGVRVVSMVVKVVMGMAALLVDVVVLI